MYQKIIAIVLALFLVGCATQQYIVVDPSGRSFPNPHYVLKAIGNDLTVMFYYTDLDEIKDADGTPLKVPTYLHLHEKNVFSWDKNHSLILTAEIHNPKLVRYSVYEDFNLTTWVGGQMSARRKIGMSDFRFRRFQVSLPTWEGVKEVSHHLEIKSGKEEFPCIMVGDFNYRVENPDDRNPYEGR
jgi:hypothetical protein